MGIVDYSSFELISDKEYYSSYGEYMSVSLLKRFAEDPIGFDEYMKNRKENEKPTDALVFGQAAHTLILEGGVEFDSLYTNLGTLVQNPRTGKSYGRKTKAFADACEEAQINMWRALTPEEVTIAFRMRAAIDDHPVASEAIELCDHVEWALRGSLANVKFQGKLDACNKSGLIVDLKTMRSDATGAEQIRDYKYLWQAYCYTELYAKAFDMEQDDVTFKFVFVTKEDNPRVEVIEVDQRDYSWFEAETGVINALNGLKISEQIRDRRAALFFLGDL